MDMLLATPRSYGLLVARVVLGTVMFAHGAQKLFGWFGGPGPDSTFDAFASMGIVAPLTALVMAAEVLGGIGLVLGCLARVASAGVMAVLIGAIVIVHQANGFFMNWAGLKAGEGFEYHLLALALGAAVLIDGAGAFSVDRAVLEARPVARAPLPLS